MQGDQLEGLVEIQVSSEKSPYKGSISGTGETQTSSRTTESTRCGHRLYVGWIFGEAIISKTRMCLIKCISVFHDINTKYGLLHISDAVHKVKIFRPWRIYSNSMGGMTQKRSLTY